MNNFPLQNSLSYSGYCNSCKTIHSLPSEKAILHCIDLMQNLKKNKRIDFEFEKPDERLSTHHLYEVIGGKMFGVLVCEDVSGNEVILKGYSSTYNGVWNVNDWVPHLANKPAFMAIVEKGNSEIHPLTDSINSIEKNSEAYHSKTSERKLISKKILEELYALYEVTNFKNETRSLQNAFNIRKRMPNGTGDCCAPKLLNFAAKNNLKPISLAEFYWGKTSPSGDKIESKFYSSCSDKCQPLLGFMLCGL